MSDAESRAKRAAYQREWSARNLERARELRRQSRDRHIGKRLAYDRARYAADRERGRAKAKAWRDANLERARIREQAWKTQNRAKMASYRRDWMAEVPTRAKAVHAAISANRRAELYGADGHVSYENVLDLWRRQPVCVACGNGLGLDHVIPLSKGGMNTTGNLQTLCKPCNSAKGARLPEAVPA